MYTYICILLLGLCYSSFLILCFYIVYTLNSYKLVGFISLVSFKMFFVEFCQKINFTVVLLCSSVFKLNLMEYLTNAICILFVYPKPAKGVQVNIVLKCAA